MHASPTLDTENSGTDFWLMLVFIARKSKIDNVPSSKASPTYGKLTSMSFILHKLSVVNKCVGEEPSPSRTS